MLMAGCGMTNTAATTPALETNAPAPGLIANGVWRGAYDCAQGTTGLTLSIAGTSSRALEAKFSFSVGQGGITGAYHMTGTYNEADRTLVLRPSTWISQPPGYHMVGLTARLSPDGNKLSGRIEDAGCGALNVSREGR